MALFPFRFIALRHAFEGALRHSDLSRTAALVRLRELVPLNTVQLEDRLALLCLAQSGLLRGGELTLLQRFEIAVLAHALSLIALSNRLRIAIVPRPPFKE